MPSPHSLYDLRVILIVSAYFYMDMYCFGLIHIGPNWSRVGPVAAESFGWVVAGGFLWLQMVSGGFGWFEMVCCFSSYEEFPEYQVYQLRTLSQKIF